MYNYDDLTTILKELCESESLVFVGLVSVEKEADYPHFMKWIEDGKHAGMEFMANHTHCREDPRNLLDGSKSAVIVALNYFQGDTGKYPKKDEPVRIAQYARLKDYHKILRERAENIVEKLRNKIKVPFEFRAVTDSAPILERALAAKSGSGFIGKNTCYIDSNEGSWLLLAEILLTLDVNIPNAKMIDPASRSPEGGCGSCTRCQTSCPTGALSIAYKLDARKCTSYYSIEHRDVVPLEYWSTFKSYLFGCDICQSVCPYNRGKKVGANLPIKIPETPDLFEIATMDQSYYVKTFGGTPVTRGKKAGLKRNALISMVVRNDSRYLKAVDLIKLEADFDANGYLANTIDQIPQYFATYPESKK